MHSTLTFGCQGVSKFLSIQDKNRTLQLPVTNLIVMCNGVSRSLSTTATEFTFTDAGCVSATAANISLTATNEAGSTMADTSVSPGEFDFHVYTLHYAYKTEVSSWGGCVCRQSMKI